jgi:hypothetical protein
VKGLSQNYFQECKHKIRRQILWMYPHTLKLVAMSFKDVVQFLSFRPHTNKFHNQTAGLQPNTIGTVQSFQRGMWQCSWLRHYATSRKVACSFPNEVNGFFNSPNPTSCTMAMGLTQPLTKLSIRTIPEAKISQSIRLTTSLPSVNWLSRKWNVGALTSHNPIGLQGLLRG